jgi:hypothetical protein
VSASTDSPAGTAVYELPEGARVQRWDGHLGDEGVGWAVVGLTGAEEVLVELLPRAQAREGDLDRL